MEALFVIIVLLAVAAHLSQSESLKIYKLWPARFTQSRRGDIERAKTCREAADELGLRFGAADFTGLLGPAIVGTIEGYSVEIRLKGESAYWISVDGKGRIPRQLVIENKASNFDGHDITHDPRFDRRIQVTGPAQHAIALLSESTRELVQREIFRQHTKVQDGEIVWGKEVVDEKEQQSPWNAADPEDFTGLKDGDGLVSQVRAMVKLAKALTMDEKDIPQMLARNATTEIRSSVALNNLKLLLNSYSISPHARETCRTLLHARSGDLRFHAARFLDVEGFETLKALVADEHLSGRIRAEAIKHLVAKSLPDPTPPIFQADQVASLLENVIGFPDLILRRAAIEGLGKLRHRDALERILGVIEDADIDTLIVVGRALAEINDPRARPSAIEGECIRILESGGETDQIEAARALGNFGTVAAVEPLKHFAKGRNRKLRRAVEDAIRSIQASVVDADKGRLSVAETEEREGALSISTDAGGLSITSGEDADATDIDAETEAPTQDERES